MNKSKGLAVRFFKSKPIMTGLAALPLAIAMGNASAVEVNFGDDISGTWDTTVSVGNLWRTESQRRELRATDDYLTARLGGYSAQLNKNDGNVNHDTGTVSTVGKITTELDLQFKQNYGAFIRATASYDNVIQSGGHDGGSANCTTVSAAAISTTVATLAANQASGFPNNGCSDDYSEDAEDFAGQRSEILDAFIWGEHDIAGKPLTWRLGQQVISWGESIFLVDGINSANPVELVALRQPGAEIKEAFRPLGAAHVQLGLTDNISMEAFYQFEWDHSLDAPAGTFWSTHDAFPAEGADNVLVDAAALTVANLPGGTPLNSTTFNAAYPTTLGAILAYQTGVYGAGVQLDNPITALSIDRARDEEASDDGQYGIAFRYFAESLNNTEFGFYFMNYHSHLPVAAARLGGALAVTTDAGVLAAANTALAGASAPTLANGTEAGLLLGCGAELQGGAPGAACTGLGAANAAYGALLGGLPGTATALGSAATAVGTMNVFSQIDNTEYFMVYPEDIELYGLSFNTAIAGISFAGEVAYRPKLPIINEIGDNLLAGLAGAAASLANASSPTASAAITPHCIRAGSQDAPCVAQQIQNGQTYYFFDEFETYNASVASIFNLGPKFGTDGMFFVLEVGATHVAGLDEDLNYGSTAALLSSEDPEGDSYLTATSWGYRGVLKADYQGLIPGTTVTPSIRFAHDVNGNSYLGGNYLENRKSATLGVSALYENKLEVSLQASDFWGAGYSNKLDDHDNASLVVKYSF